MTGKHIEKKCGDHMLTTDVSTKKWSDFVNTKKWSDFASEKKWSNFVSEIVNAKKWSDFASEKKWSVQRTRKRGATLAIKVEMRSIKSGGTMALQNHRTILIIYSISDWNLF